MHFIPKGFNCFSLPNSPDPRQHVPLMVSLPEDFNLVLYYRRYFSYEIFKCSKCQCHLGRCLLLPVVCNPFINFSQLLSVFSDWSENVFCIIAGVFAFSKVAIKLKNTMATCTFFPQKQGACPLNQSYGPSFVAKQTALVGMDGRMFVKHSII